MIPTLRDRDGNLIADDTVVEVAYGQRMALAHLEQGLRDCILVYERQVGFAVEVTGLGIHRDIPGTVERVEVFARART